MPCLRAQCFRLCSPRPEGGEGLPSTATLQGPQHAQCRGAHLVAHTSSNALPCPTRKEKSSMLGV